MLNRGVRTLKDLDNEEEKQRGTSLHRPAGRMEEDGHQRARGNHRQAEIPPWLSKGRSSTSLLFFIIGHCQTSSLVTAEDQGRGEQF